MPPVPKSGKMPAVIVLWLLSLFSTILLYPMFSKGEKPSEGMIQNLIILLVAGVSFFIGTTQKSGEKDDTIARAIPQATTPVVQIDTSKTGPVEVTPVKE